MRDRKNGSSMQDRYLIMVGLMLIVLLSTASIVQLVHIGNLERIFNKRAENCISQKNSLVEENVALTKQNEYLLDEIEGKVSGPTIPILSDEEKNLEKIINSDIATWDTYQNNELGYSFKYPSELELSGMVGEGDSPNLPRLGVMLRDAQKKSSYVYIFEPSKNDISHNPNAKTLNDYKDSYFANNERKVVLISQKEILLPSGKSLKQIYSAGDAKEKLLAKKSFSFANNSNVFDKHDLYKMSFAYENNAIRYVIPQGKNRFVILKTWKNKKLYEKLLDKIANTFQFTNK